MPNIVSRIGDLFRNQGPLPKVTPMKEMGVSGTAVFGGIVQNRERDSRLYGHQKWLTFSELMTNTSIVSAGTRYMLNLIAYSKWTVEPADESDEAKKVAEFVEEVINDTETPWKRIMRRAAIYRFHGFGIQEWTAKRRDDGKIGFEDIESRPQHTIERWEVNDSGTVIGVWQRAPMGGDLLYLPRGKILYLVDDSLTDSPEGIGIFRHLVEPWERLKTYLQLEGRGFERDLRGIPIGRLPYTEIRKAVAAGHITTEQATKITKDIEHFVEMQTKSSDTSIVLDSIPYINQTASGPAFVGSMQYGLELLNGGSQGFAEMGAAIDRTVHDMARIIGVENILLGDKGGGSRALSADKSQNFYLVVNGTLDEIKDGGNKDVIGPLCDLNGIKKEMRPKLKHSEVSFRSVNEVTTSLQQMAAAGAVLAPNDPAIDDVRDLLGISQQPEATPAQMGLMGVGPEAPQNKLMQTKIDNPNPGKVPGKEQPAGKPGGTPVNDNQEVQNVVKKLLEKFNEHHGEGGRFASADSAGKEKATSAKAWLNKDSVKKFIHTIADSPKTEAVIGAGVSYLMSHVLQFSDPIAEEMISTQIHTLASTMMVSQAKASEVMRQTIEGLKNIHAAEGTWSGGVKKADDPILTALNAILDALDRYDAKRLIKVGDVVIFVDDDLEKFNEAHDERGRFASGDSAGGGAQHGINIRSDMSMKPSGPPAQAVQSLTDLYDRAKAGEAEFQRVVGNVAKITNGTMLLPSEKSSETGTRLKSMASAQRKLRDELNGDYTKILDVMRATVVYKTVEESRQGLARFIAENRNNIVRIKDRQENPVGGGYRDILVNFRTPNGVIAELQFNTKNMLDAKNGEGHKLYERLRTMKNPSVAVKGYIEKKTSLVYTSAFNSDGDSKYKTGVK